MSNPRITENQLKALERKSKAGWACYYSIKGRYDDLCDYTSSLKQRNRELYDKIKSGENGIDVEYLKSQFIEMYDKLKDYTDCPICLETISKENAKLTNCGHLFCITCYDKIDDCAICRKKLYKPRT